MTKDGKKGRRMDEKFTGWLVREHKITKIAPIDYLLLAGTFAAGVMLRAQVWGAVFENAAYQNTVLTMKIVSAIFEILVAVLTGLIVHRLTGHKIRSFPAYGIGMMLPVLVAGSAMWGMGDAVYLFFVLFSLFLLLTDGNVFVLSLVFYGMAVFFNIYALFIFPVYIWYYFTKKPERNWVSGFLAPALGIILHFVMDRGEASAFILFREEGKLAASRGSVLLSYHYPNLYQLVGADAFVHEYGTGFRYVVLGAVAIATILGMRFIKEMTKEDIVRYSLLFSIAIPWFLPFMDERAGLLAAVLSVFYGFTRLKRFYVAILQVTITYLAYAAYFRGDSFLPLSVIALVQLILFLYLVWAEATENDRLCEK
jgi:hypothetical protein